MPYRYPEDLKLNKHQYYLRNKDRMREKDRLYYLKNKDRISQRSKIHRQKNREKRQKIYLENRDRIRIQQKDYFLTHKREIYDRAINRRKNDTSYKLAGNLRTRLANILKSRVKSGSAIRDLGCSIEELKCRLERQFYPHSVTEEQMTWENYGSKWHIDHIIPLSSFDLTDRGDFLEACHWTNLQPMWAEENLRKSGKWNSQV